MKMKILIIQIKNVNVHIKSECAILKDPVERGFHNDIWNDKG